MHSVRRLRSEGHDVESAERHDAGRYRFNLLPPDAGTRSRSSWRARHAIAKGAFLLLSADYRIGVEGPFHIGLNEVQIGMTMHHAGIELARDRLRKSAFHRSVINGEMFDPIGAVDAGFLDKVVPTGELLAVAKAAAEQLKKINMVAHKNTKLKVRKALLETLDQAIALDQQHFG